MNGGTVLKWCGAALVLVSLALPMSSCDLSPIAPIQKTYAFEELSAGNPGSWLEIPLLVWPAIFAALFTWRRAQRLALGLRLAEPLLIVASIAMVLAYSVMGQREVGTWFALSGLALYSAGALVEDVRALRRRAANAPERTKAVTIP